jgi:hypothetical protein
MFGWLKRRLVREHKKLLWQNENAANDDEMMIRLQLRGLDKAATALNLMAAIARTQLREGVPPNGLQ